MSAGFGFSTYGTFPYGFGSTATIPYPIGTSKIVIPDTLDWGRSSMTICFDVWIDPVTSVDTALLCHGGGSTIPAWYIGYVGSDIKAAISDLFGSTVDATISASGYQYRWVSVGISYNFVGGNTQYCFQIDGTTILSGTLSGTLIYTTLDDVISGMGGRIRNIRRLETSDAPSTTIIDSYANDFLSYFDVVYNSSITGSWAIDDNSTNLVDPVEGNDGTLWAGGLWSNGPNDITVVGSPTWTLTTGISRRDTSEIDFRRQVLETAPSSIIVEQDRDDANRLDIFDGYADNPVTTITDDASGAILTFEKPFLADQQNDIELNRDITVLGGSTIADGTSYSWTLPLTTDLGYEATSITVGINSFLVEFNVDIKEGNGKVSGIDPAMWVWSKTGVTIYTDDTGARTVTLSEFTDLSGNIIPDATFEVTILEQAVRFDYQGMQMIQTQTYKDGFAQSISREAKNYVSEKLREESDE